MKIKLNVDLGKYKKDTIIKIDVDSCGIPTDKYWRTRLKDSEKDNCIEVVQEKATNNKTKKRVEE